jgi:hypothetical protein
METEDLLRALADDISEAIKAVDRRTVGQYGEGIGSEDEEDQLELLLEELRKQSGRYSEAELEAPYPNSEQSCDLLLPQEVPVECKLIRYWRANGDPEHYMPMRVFSPFNENTILTDAQKITSSSFERDGGLLGLFYKRSESDPENVRSLPERFNADDLAKKIARDIQYWHGVEAEICAVAKFSGLRHEIHKQGAAITWKLN